MQIKFSAIAVAAEVPLFTEEHVMSRVCRSKGGNWGIGLSGGVLRSRFTLDEFLEMFRDGVGMGTEKLCLDTKCDDDDEDTCIDYGALPPDSMFG
jgi:hypothetical protein